jgi:hypothetical protein
MPLNQIISDMPSGTLSFNLLKAWSTCGTVQERTAAGTVTFEPSAKDARKDAFHRQQLHDLTRCMQLQMSCLAKAVQELQEVGGPQQKASMNLWPEQCPPCINFEEYGRALLFFLLLMVTCLSHDRKPLCPFFALKPGYYCLCRILYVPGTPQPSVLIDAAGISQACCPGAG